MKEPHELWHQEEILINHRITWLLASQSLLFAGFGWIKKDDNSLALILANLGLATSAFILLGILAAVSAQFILIKNKHYVWLPATIAGWITAIGLSAAFVVAWNALLSKYIA